MPHIGLLLNGYLFWQKVEDKRKGFKIVEPEQSSEILVPSSNPRTFRKYNQSCIARQCIVTRRFYRVGNGQELWSIVNHGLIPGGVSLRMGRQAVFFTVVNPMENQDGLGDTLCDLTQARIAPYKNTWKRLSENSKLVQFEARSTKRTAILSNKVKHSSPQWHNACRVHWQSDMHENQGSALWKGKRDSKTACCSHSYFAMWFTRSTCPRSKIILGIAKTCGELRRNPKQHCWLQNTRYIDLNGETAGCTATK